MTLTRASWQRLGWDTTYPEDRVEIKKPVIDSRKASKGVAFFAYDGTEVSGKDFIFQALEKGAAAVFLDIRHKKEIIENPNFDSTFPIFFGLNFRKIAGNTISFLNGDPSQQMHIVGVTGTNGKTTTSLMIHETLTKLKKKSIYIGTLGVYTGKEKKETGLTTPDIVSLHEILKKAHKKKIAFGVIEASSHGLVQGRLEGIEFNLGIFTNLSAEHMDYHQNMEDYYEAKRILFLKLVETARSHPQAVNGAVIHTDTVYGQRLANELKKMDARFPIITVGAEGDARIAQVEPSWGGYQGLLLWAQKSYKIHTSMLGTFNLYNFVSAFLALLLLGFKAEEILPVLQKYKGPEGRMQVIPGPDGRHIIIDYAHTPDALENVLSTIQELNPIRTIVVFGCGGERDKEKRPQMGKIANTIADFTILTNDNPRKEDPQTIINDIKSGMKGASFIVIPEREKAIRAGLQILGPQETLVIAGKGHENYQIIGNKKHAFSDIDTVKKMMESIRYE